MVDGAHPEIKPTGGMTNKGALYITRPGLELEKEPVSANIKKAKVFNLAHDSIVSEPEKAETKLSR